jgi:D-alanyl-D-alanine carboxypeptidase
MIILIALLFAATCSASLSDDSTSSVSYDAGLTSMAATAREQSGSPAVGILLVADGTACIGVSGHREVRGDTPVTSEDLWHLGSNTKSMTAVLVARLAERGVVSWDDTISHEFPEWEHIIDPAYGELTYRHLLSHRAGLAPKTDLGEMRRFAQQQPLDWSLEQRRRSFALNVLEEPPIVRPELEFSYSNAGYIVVAAMLERATGMLWEVLLEQELFIPLHMSSAGFGAPGSLSVVDQPRGHRAGLFGRLTPQVGTMADIPQMFGPAGSVHASPTDLAAYLTAHMSGQRGDETSFLSTESWSVLHTPPFGGDYAMGWARRGPMLMHGGSNSMWLMEIVAIPDRNLAIAIMFNESRMDRLAPAIGPIMQSLLDNPD